MSAIIRLCCRCISWQLLNLMVYQNWLLLVLRWWLLLNDGLLNPLVCNCTRVILLELPNELVYFLQVNLSSCSIHHAKLLRLLILILTWGLSSYCILIWTLPCLRLRLGFILWWLLVLDFLRWSPLGLWVWIDTATIASFAQSWLLATYSCCLRCLAYSCLLSCLG